MQMSKAEQVVQKLEEIGGALHLTPDQLLYRLPPEPPAGLEEEISKHRQEIVWLILLRDWNPPAVRRPQ